MEMLENTPSLRVIVNESHSFKCPFCGSDNLVKHGTLPDGRQKYKCRNCGRYPKSGRDGYNFKMKNKQVVIKDALRLYESLSLRDIAREIRRVSGVRISHVAIARWIDKYYTQNLETLSIPCFNCMWLDTMKERVCKPIDCAMLDQWLDATSVVQK